MIVKANCIFIIQLLMIKAQHEKKLRIELLREIDREQNISSLDKSMHQTIEQIVYAITLTC